MRERHWTIQQDNTYRSGNLVMARGPNERILCHLYYGMEACGRAETFFHEGKPSLLWFLTEFQKPEISTLACYREGKGGSYDLNGTQYEPIGLGFINRSWNIGPKELGYRKAETGMGFLRGVSTDESLRCADMMMAWAWDNLQICTLVGTTPVPNRAAVLFGQKCGFNQAGPISGYTMFNGRVCDAIIQSMTRDQWNAMWSTSNVRHEEAA